MNILKWLDEHIEEVLLVLFSVTMVVSIALQVFMRFALGSSLAWSEELARFCFIWLVYIGISYGVKKQRHIKVDVVLILLKDKMKIALTVVANLIFLAFAMYVIIYGYSIAEKLLAWGQTSPALGLPMGYVYLATPIGMSLTAFRIVQQLIKQLKSLFGEEQFEVKSEHELLLEREAELIKEEKNELLDKK